MSIRRTTRASNSVDEWKLEAVLGSLLELSDNQGRILCPPFRILESQDEFPLYYEQIKNPIDLRTIAVKIREEKYLTWSSIEADVKLLCKNAKTFNQPGSIIFKDACSILSHFTAKKEEIMHLKHKLSSNIIEHNKHLITTLIESNVSEPNILSEDSEEDEDSESDLDPKWILYWKIRNFDVVDGFPLCTHFLELPSKKMYPDYYDEIENPVSLYMINKQLKNNTIPDLPSLVKILFQMYENARAYNCEDSEIYSAANKLQDLTVETAKVLQPDIKMEIPIIPTVVKDQIVEREKEKSTSIPRKKKVIQKLFKKHKKATSSSDSDGPEFQPSKNLVKKTKSLTATERKTDSYEKELTKKSELNNSKQEENFYQEDSFLEESKFKRKKRRINRTAGLGRPPKDPERLEYYHLQRKRRKIWEDNAEKSKPGRKSLDELRANFSQKLMEVWKVAKDLKICNRNVSFHFMELPSADDYPDYYKVIKKPIDMSIILNKIENAQYQDSTELLADFTTMCQNAKTYNRIDSQIYSDASIIQSVVESTLKSITNDSTIYLPYKRNDKNWTELSSITKNCNGKSRKYKVKSEVESQISVEDTQSETRDSLTNQRFVPTGQTPRSSSTPLQIATLSMTTPYTMPTSFSNIITQSNINQQFPYNAQQSSANVQSLQSTVNGTAMYIPSNYVSPYVLNSPKNTMSKFRPTIVQPVKPTNTMDNNMPNITQLLRNQLLRHNNYPIQSSVIPQTSSYNQHIMNRSNLHNPVQVKRVLHSEAYIKYIESLHSLKEQRTISKWDQSLQASYKNTAFSNKKLPLDWIKNVVRKRGLDLSNAKPLEKQTKKLRMDRKLSLAVEHDSSMITKQEQETLKAFWRLRDQLLEKTTGIQKLLTPLNGKFNEIINL